MPVVPFIGFVSWQEKRGRSSSPTTPSPTLRLSYASFVLRFFSPTGFLVLGFTSPTALMKKGSLVLGLHQWLGPLVLTLFNHIDPLVLRGFGSNGSLVLPSQKCLGSVVLREPESRTPSSEQVGEISIFKFEKKNREAPIT